MIKLFLKATEDPSREYIYLLNNKYFILQSVSDYKSKIQQVCLAETDFQGNYKYTGDVALIMNAEDFKNHARIVDGKEFIDLQLKSNR